MLTEGKEYACNMGDLGSILGSERSSGEETGYLLQYCLLKNSMDIGAWRPVTERPTLSCPCSEENRAES